jgi:ABC-type nitrate/sulfonate/bicarbonate transport system substrate-binding protein
MIGRRAAIRDAGRMLGAGALLGLTGCAGSGNPQTSTAIPSPTIPLRPPSPVPSTPTVLSSSRRVRVALAGSTGEAGIFIAIAKGYFQQAGIEIEPVSFDSVVRAIPALGTNQIEVGAGAIGAAFFTDAGVEK